MDPLVDDLTRARAVEVPDARLCARIARRLLSGGDREGAAAWAVRAVDGGEDATAWTAAAKVLADNPAPGHLRTAKVWVVGTATTDVLTAVLPAALARERVAASVDQTGFGLYWQEILDPSSTLHRADPDVVVLVPHLGATSIDGFRDDHDEVVEAEVARWSSAWDRLREDRARHVVQVGFVPPDSDPFGHLAAGLPGSRLSMIRALNARLAVAAAGADVACVDAASIAARLGRDGWFDPRWWFVAKHDPAIPAVPSLARSIAVVVAARLGLARKCLVTDLDGTLWGGSIGDDGLSEISLGGTAEGEAHVELQRVMRDLRERGVILAVCSKNTDEIARSPFLEHPEMVLGIDDVAAFVANWDPKPVNLRRIADGLDIGLDSIAFLDDNPAEREAIRSELPEVDVIMLPPDPAGYPAALSRYPRFETPAFSEEDRSRTEKYRARAAAEEARQSARSLEEFLVDLEMRATLGPIVGATEARVAQLLGKTNQWNMTTRRHSLDDVRRMATDPTWVTITGRLADRLADHGLVAVLLAREEGDTLDVDSFVMSCRVIGRRLEHALFDALVAEARRRSCRGVTATYVPTERNGLIADVYEELGLCRVARDEDGTTHWRLDVDGVAPLDPPMSVTGGPTRPEGHDG
ncbi:MAG: HAD-IIIC family phosphatase [Acidimicrobiales bacterium]